MNSFRGGRTGAACTPGVSLGCGPPPAPSSLDEGRGCQWRVKEHSGARHARDRTGAARVVPCVVHRQEKGSQSQWQTRQPRGVRPPPPRGSPPQFDITRAVLRVCAHGPATQGAKRRRRADQGRLGPRTHVGTRLPAGGNPGRHRGVTPPPLEERPKGIDAPRSAAPTPTGRRPTCVGGG